HLGRELAAPRVGEAVDAGADVAGGTGVGLTGRVPERAVGGQGQVAGGQAGKLVGDRCPVAAAGAGTPDATVRSRRVDVPGVVGRETGDPAGHVARTAAGV